MIEEVSQYGDIIKSNEVSIYIQNQNYHGDICIDTPQNNSQLIKQDIEKLIISGWAVSDDRNATVRLKVDGKLEKNELTRIKRADVDKIVSPNYGGESCTPNAGFYEIIDTRMWSIRNA